MPKKKTRKNEIIVAATEAARDVGYQNIQRVDVARIADCATGTVNHYYGTMKQLKRAVVRYAIEQEDHSIIAQAVMNNDPLVGKLTNEEKQQACLNAINS